MSSTTFFRSAQFLDDDDFGNSLSNFVLISVLIIGWLAWFFFAEITIYQETDHAYFESKTQLMAEFPSAALAQIQPSQSAQLRLHDFPWTRYGTVNASVTKVEYKDGHVQVRLSALPDTNTRVELQRGITGKVIIPVDKVSPARLVLYTATERLVQSEDEN